MNLVDKLKDGLKIALGRKLSQSQMRNAKRVSYFEVVDNPGVITLNGDGYFRKYEKIALKEKHPDDGKPLIRTIASSYTPDGLLYHVETVEETSERCRLQETFYTPAGSFDGNTVRYR